MIDMFMKGLPCIYGPYLTCLALFLSKLLVTVTASVVGCVEEVLNENRA